MTKKKKENQRVSPPGLFFFFVLGDEGGYNKIRSKEGVISAVQYAAVLLKG